MDNHKKRITQELREAGMTSYGLLKMETNKLPSIIHLDEHIGGVVYGRTTGDKVGSAMLIATDKRIIFLDVKPLFTTLDEVSYFVVSGIKENYAGPFAGVVLHTKVRDYGLRFVNRNCARQFVTYIEHHLEKFADDNKIVINEPDVSLLKLKEEADITYIKSHTSAVLSTVSKTGIARGSVIHYVYKDGYFYFVTKDETLKSQNIALHGQVALTIHDTNSLKTAQISGLAESETDKRTVSSIIEEISTPKQYNEGNHFPPIISLKRGNFVVVRIVPTTIEFHDYSKPSW